LRIRLHRTRPVWCADTSARRGASVVRYSFAVGLFHSFHPFGLDRRTENFWASEQTSVVELVGQQDVLDKSVYALTNPVQAHLVEHAHQWPGAT
jgi:hypothetical protein